ncbi:MAG: class I SAM-dependent methyltransferase [Betaproteobacteria bacterium]|nr:class I SAM-dependent methyltransferase [Betaproteobacteria bacterium]
MHCYICHSNFFTPRKGEVRDASGMQILQCKNCGLVTLGSIGHIQPGFYENSGMHGMEPTPMAVWLRETEWDDQRRLEMVKTMLPNKKLLDFGCGAGGFLQKAQPLAGEVAGIELESRVHDHWAGRLKIYPSIGTAGRGYDLITAFHVIEHLPDPRAMLAELAGLLAPQGRMIIEVPSSEDALLTLYDCDAFQRFTYWSQHLFLFNTATLETLARQAGLRVTAIRHYQRYPLSNHLHWLSRGKPGGHQQWSFLDSPDLVNAYADALAAVGRSDTLIAYLEAAD